MHTFTHQLFGTILEIANKSPFAISAVLVSAHIRQLIDMSLSAFHLRCTLDVED